jgi:hypothetical protein
VLTETPLSCGFGTGSAPTVPLYCRYVLCNLPEDGTRIVACADAECPAS